MTTRRVIQNVIFDLGGVLLEWNPDKILAQLYSGDDVRALVRTEVFQHPDWLELDRGTLEEDVAVRLFSERTGRPLSEMKTLMETVRTSLIPMPPSFELLEALSEEGMNLYCLSNMQSAVFAYLLRRYDFWGEFKGIVTSASVRMIKPDEQIFNHILSRYGLSPKESLFIDDHPPNVEMARRLEMPAILFQGAEHCRHQLQQSYHLLCQTEKRGRLILPVSSRPGEKI